MHQTLLAIRNQLDALVTQLKQQFPNDQPLNIAHGHWGFAGLKRGARGVAQARAGAMAHLILRHEVRATEPGRITRCARTGRGTETVLPRIVSTQADMVSSGTPCPLQTFGLLAFLFACRLQKLDETEAR